MIGRGFQVAFCASCEREVLLAVQLRDDELVQCCLHCETVPAGPAREAGPDLLDRLGYDVPGQQKSGKRGCRGGACGVRQPA